MSGTLTNETYAEARIKTRDYRVEAYRHDTLQSSYERDEGLLVIPVMGAAGVAPAVVRVHAPIGFRKVNFEYAKDRVPPIFPAQADTDSGDTVLTSTLNFPTPALQTNGDLTFGVAGEYVFVQPLGGRSTEDKYPIDKHPYVSIIDAMHTLPHPTPYEVENEMWCWNSQDIDARLLGSYGILG